MTVTFQLRSNLVVWLVRQTMVLRSFRISIYVAQRLFYFAFSNIALLYDDCPTLPREVTRFPDKQWTVPQTVSCQH